MAFFHDHNAKGDRLSKEANRKGDEAKKTAEKAEREYATGAAEMMQKSERENDKSE